MVQYCPGEAPAIAWARLPGVKPSGTLGGREVGKMRGIKAIIKLLQAITLLIAALTELIRVLKTKNPR